MGRDLFTIASCLFTFSTDLHLIVYIFVYNCQLFIYITIITGQLHRITFSSRSRQTSSGRNAIGSRSNSSHQRSVYRVLIPPMLALLLPKVFYEQSFNFHGDFQLFNGFLTSHQVVTLAKLHFILRPASRKLAVKSARKCF